MQYTISQGTFGVRPQVQLPTPAFLDYLGEDGMRKLVNDHYDLLAVSAIKGLFPPSAEGLAMAKKHSADFFIQICGGHPHFNENRGAPKMAARHAPFKITLEARLVWLECYQIVLSKLEAPEELKKSFWNYIDIFSLWMVNTPSEN